MSHVWWQTSVWLLFERRGAIALLYYGRSSTPPIVQRHICHMAIWSYPQLVSSLVFLPNLSRYLILILMYLLSLAFSPLKTRWIPPVLTSLKLSSRDKSNSAQFYFRFVTVEISAGCRSCLLFYLVLCQKNYSLSCILNISDIQDTLSIILEGVHYEMWKFEGAWQVKKA